MRAVLWRIRWREYLIAREWGAEKMARDGSTVQLYLVLACGGRGSTIAGWPCPSSLYDVDIGRCHLMTYQISCFNRFMLYRHDSTSRSALIQHAFHLENNPTLNKYVVTFVQHGYGSWGSALSFSVGWWSYSLREYNPHFLNLVAQLFLKNFPLNKYVIIFVQHGYGSWGSALCLLV
jgi:hypothetical protein